ncbi:hypothetical protein ABZX95_30895 [Streptomyces sp. NPDC004232]|uniref:hypothetical protein n=1 Tax=unclassified Streptomyces TaxID=2593676 RepID=UPI0033B32766
MNHIPAFRQHRIIARVFAVGALGVALATTAATPSSAVAARVATVQSRPADHDRDHEHEHGREHEHEHEHGDHDEGWEGPDCVGLINLLC